MHGFRKLILSDWLTRSSCMLVNAFADKDIDIFHLLFGEQRQMALHHRLIETYCRSRLGFLRCHLRHFGGSLGDERYQQFERDIFFAGDLRCQCVHMIHEVARIDGCQMQITPLFTGQVADIAGEGTGQLFQQKSRVGAAPLNEEGDGYKIYFPLLAESLQGYITPYSLVRAAKSCMGRLPAVCAQTPPVCGIC